MTVLGVVVVVTAAVAAVIAFCYCLLHPYHFEYNIHSLSCSPLLYLITFLRFLLAHLSSPHRLPHHSQLLALSAFMVCKGKGYLFIYLLSKYLSYWFFNYTQSQRTLSRVRVMHIYINMSIWVFMLSPLFPFSFSLYINALEDGMRV